MIKKQNFPDHNQAPQSNQKVVLEDQNKGTNNFSDKNHFFQNNPNQNSLKNSKETIEKQRVKSKPRIIILGLIVSISAVIFGYSLMEITSIPIDTLINEYSITMSKSGTQSLLIGILPLGSVFASFFTTFFIHHFTRRRAIYIFAVINCGAVVIDNITIFGVLLFGRFMEGVCVGIYSAIAPIYLKEIAPKQLRRLMGLFFSFGKILGVMIAISLQHILDVAHVSISWRVILSVTFPLAIVQVILLFIFGFDTPSELIEKERREEALQIIKDVYKEEYVDEVFNQYVKQYEVELNKEKLQEAEEDAVQQQVIELLDQNDAKNQKNGQSKANLVESNSIMEKYIQLKIQLKLNTDNITQQKQKNNRPSNTNSLQPTKPKQQKKTLNFNQKKRLAYWIGIHLCLLRHFTGGNAVIQQGGLFITGFDPSLGKYASLIINFVQFVFVVFGMLYLQTKLGKRPLFMLSLSLLIILNFGIVVAAIFEQILPVLILLCLHIAIYGGFFISLTWAYPSEVIPAKQSLIPNIVQWLGLAVSTLVPPLITGVMPNGNPYPVFIFFGAYSFFGFLHIWRYLRESDGRNYHQIIQSYK